MSLSTIQGTTGWQPSLHTHRTDFMSHKTDATSHRTDDMMSQQETLCNTGQMSCHYNRCHVTQRTSVPSNMACSIELKQCLPSTVYSGTDLTGEVHMPRRVNEVDQVFFAICMESGSMPYTLHSPLVM